MQARETASETVIVGLDFDGCVVHEGVLNKLRELVNTRFPDPGMGRPETMRAQTLAFDQEEISQHVIALNQSLLDHIKTLRADRRLALYPAILL